LENLVGRKISFLILRLLFVSSLGSHFAFAGQSDVTSGCTNMLANLRARKSAQPVWVDLKNPGIIPVHNQEFAEILSNGYSPEILKKIILRLIEEDSLIIPLNEMNMMVASTTGTYSRKGWDRDHLRGAAAQRGLGRRGLATQMTMASLIRYGKQSWRVVNVLKDIEDHPNKFERRYTKEGHAVLPQVVLDPMLLDDLRDSNGNLVPWSVQKDAWALYLHSALDNLDAASVEKLTAEQKVALAGMFALMVKIEYWDFATADAWEEENQIFTGGVGLVTSALERLYDAPENNVVAKIIESVIRDEKIDSRTRSIIERATTKPELRKAIDKGYERIYQQIDAGGESPKIGEQGMGRTADISLLWLFSYRLNRFTEADYNRVSEILDKLMTKTGMPRYRDPYEDGYLNAGYFFGDNEVLPKEMTRVNSLRDGDREYSITGGVIRHLFYTHQTARLEEIFGKDFSAEWPLGLAFRVQEYRNKYDWFPESPNREKYKKKARDFLMRAVGTATPGPKKNGEGKQERAIGLDGRELPAYRFGEATTPVRTYNDKNEVVEELSSFSPFTPLNWATAEVILGLLAVWSMDHPGEPFPLQ
jgi:hypothetical protein